MPGAAAHVLESFCRTFGEVLRAPGLASALTAGDPPGGDRLLDDRGVPVAAVRDGVMDFVCIGHDDRGAQRGFGYQWDRILAGKLSDKVVYNNTRADLKHGMLTWLEMSEPDFKGLRCVDMGCGHGQYVRVLAEMGAAALGVDLSEVVYRCHHEDRAINPQLDTTYLRADLLNLPIVPRSFDVVISIGVSNATPDARAAAIAAARRVKPGGRFLFYNYEKGAVGYINVRERLPFLTGLPRPLLLWVCRAMAIPLAFYLAGRHGKLPSVQTFTTAALGLFDGLEPRYCWTETPETILSWLRSPEAGLTEVRRVAPCFYTARGAPEIHISTQQQAAAMAPVGYPGKQRAGTA